MRDKDKARSTFLVFLMFSSILVSLIGPASIVSANNETESGTITGTEIWSGVHQLTGDVTIATGAQLIINPGTIINIPNGTHIDVRGSICAGEYFCGASSNANPSQKIKFQWSDPLVSNATGSCAGLTTNNQEISVTDPSCYEGILIRSSIDLSLTGMRHVVIEGAYGIPHFINSVNEWRYGALVIDGASPTLRNLDFSDINTSSIVTTNLAQPILIDGSFTVGNDEESNVGGSALQIYNSGTSIAPFTLNSPFFKQGTNKGCQSNDGGRSALWAQESFININNADIGTGDFGVTFRDTAGKFTNSTIDVNCVGISVQGKRTVNSVSFGLDILNNQVTTAEGTGIFTSNSALVDIRYNAVQGASAGSGIAVSSSVAKIHENIIGPITGYNGLWLFGSFEVEAENNTISDTNREPIIAGAYSNSDTSISNLYLVNNDISTDGTGTCSSNKWWGGSFFCPAIMIFRSGATIHDNDIQAGSANAIMAIGALLDVQRNIFDGALTGALIKNYNDGFAGSEQYGSLAFFSQNIWSNVGMTYNITKSSVTVQSETIPAAATGEYPVRLSWPDQEAWHANNFQTKIMVPPVKSCPACDEVIPRNFPLALNMDNNSTVFTFSNLTNLDTNNIYIETQPTHYAVQVSRAELVRFQALINGEKVSDALVLIEDALGNDLYSILTVSDGYTPWFSLPSNFHLDFRGLGGGDNPDGFADDEYEDSCSDGIDNDGDLTVDSNDVDCNYSEGTRELSRFFYTIYRFGFGYATGEFTLEESTYQDSINLVNLAPSVQITQSNGHSYRKIVNITGNAHDGQLANSYASNEFAQWSQQGYVHHIEVKDPFTSEWEDAGFAVDDSDANEGTVTRFNHPFSEWYYEIDMSNREEGDYIFAFRSFDGTDYSEVVSKEFKLNTEAPIISVSTPTSLSTHSDNFIHFEGDSSDPYGCPLDCNKDLKSIYMLIEGPSFQVTTPIEVNHNGSWSWDWDFSGQPRESAAYTFTIWASDSDFCKGIIDVCSPIVLSLTVDNSNLAPIININEPTDGLRLSVSQNTQVSGVVRDFDGSVSRVDIEIKDVQNEYIIIHSLSISEFSDNGEWNYSWDSRQLKHDSTYLLRFRSYDGYDFSSWTELEIIADNPLDADNNQPTFTSEGWVENNILYCDINSKSSSRCTTIELNLLEFFEDQDYDIQYISVYNGQNSYDDNYGIVIKVSSNGIATYNPTDMNFYDNDISTWSLLDVIFVATDSFGSKINSDPISFTVEPIEFKINDLDYDTIEEEGVMLYSGTGLPGKTITVIVGGNQINSTIVSENSTWILGIPASRLPDNVASPKFSMGGQDPIQVADIFVGPFEEQGYPTGLIIVVIIIIIGIVTLAYFFVELEVDEQEKESLEGDSDFGSTNDESILQKHDDHPGWLWNPIDKEWIEDTEYVSK
ncbi:MAG: hypothetical protein ACKVI6_03185 [Candidatus Poseidoniales archaeon]|jgi:hypothetical protein|tara:strand:- start:7151 stop:11398 length:4248 start_codon:yes stop_codon:yes gene_type:complete